MCFYSLRDLIKAAFGIIFQIQKQRSDVIFRFFQSKISDTTIVLTARTILTFLLLNEELCVLWFRTAYTSTLTICQKAYDLLIR